MIGVEQNVRPSSIFHVTDPLQMDRQAADTPCTRSE